MKLEDKGVPCVVKFKDGTYESIFLEIYQVKDDQSSYPVAIVKGKDGFLRQVSLSAVGFPPITHYRDKMGVRVEV